MFNAFFPKEWSTLKRLMWLKTNALARAVYETIGPAAIVNFTTQRAAPLKSLKVALSPSQDLHGYDAPWPAGGGVNKWDGIWENGEINASDGQNSNTNTTWRSKNYIPISDSNTYVFVAQNVSKNKQVRARFYASDKSYIGYVSASGINVTLNSPFTPPIGAAYVRFAPRNDDIPTHTVALNYPATVTTYSPYSNICPISGHEGVNVWVKEEYDTSLPATVSVTFPDSVGTVYSGTLDVVSGVLTVDKAETDMGSLSWTLASSYGAHIFQASISGKAFGVSNLLSDIYDVDAVAISSIKNGGMRGHASNTNVYVRNDDYSDAQTFTTAMNGHQLVYELAEPLTYQLTPQEVLALVGENNCWSNADTVEVTYRKN